MLTLNMNNPNNSQFVFCFGRTWCVFITHQLFVRVFVLYDSCFMFVWEIVAKYFIVPSLQRSTILLLFLAYNH